MAKKNKEKTPVQRLLLPGYIYYTGKIFNFVSSSLASKFAEKLFLRPFKYKLPERERQMDKNAVQTKHILPKSNKEIISYEYGSSDRKILLVHGWSGRGTQLSMIADALIAKGYSIISFDAPAHGKAAGKMSMMLHFIEAIHYLNELHAPFYGIIGHSLGGMASLKALSEGFYCKKAVIIGTANSVTQITKEFVENLGMSKKVADKMKSNLDKKFGEDMDNYSAAVSARNVSTPILILHDRDDVDVHYSCAKEIQEQLQSSELYLTEKLGHRKILGDSMVINKISTFITA